MIAESGVLDDSRHMVPLIKESDELLSIFVASIKTVKNRLNLPKK